MRVQVLFYVLLALAAPACSSRHAREINIVPTFASTTEEVALLFERHGRETDRLATRMIESGHTVNSVQPGDGVWLRLNNVGQRVVSFVTDSLYLTSNREWYPTSDGEQHLALLDGMEISVPYEVWEDPGEHVWDGGDYCEIVVSWLPPGRSVMFSVSSETLTNGRLVCLQYAVDADVADYDADSLRRVCIAGNAIPGSAQ